jgi:hypothetical protein
MLSTSLVFFSPVPEWLDAGLLKRLSRRIRSHMRNGFSPWVRALGGVDCEKKPDVDNLVTVSL